MIRERIQPVPLLVLTLVWLGLWGGPTVLRVLGGLLLAALVLLVFPLPRLTLGLRLHPLPLLRLLGIFGRDLVRASVQVAWLSLRPGPAASGTETEVVLRCDDDLVRTLTAVMTILVPGSVIVDLSGRVMRLHVIDAHDEAALAAARNRVERTEARLLAVLEPRVPEAGPGPPEKEVAR